MSHHSEARDARRSHAKNPAQAEVFAALQAEGYEIVTRGWPSCLAVHDDGNRREIVGIVVNGPRARIPLSPPQRRMAALLEAHGIHVQVRTASVNATGAPYTRERRAPRHERGDIGG